MFVSGCYCSVLCSERPGGWPQGQRGAGLGWWGPAVHRLCSRSQRGVLKGHHGDWKTTHCLRLIDSQSSFSLPNWSDWQWYYGANLWRCWIFRRTQIPSSHVLKMIAMQCCIPLLVFKTWTEVYINHVKSQCQWNHVISSFWFGQPRCLIFVCNLHFSWSCRWTPLPLFHGWIVKTHNIPIVHAWNNDVNFTDLQVILDQLDKQRWNMCCHCYRTGSYLYNWHL